MNTKSIALIGIFTGVALVISYIEMLLPISFSFPGIKLGLTNLVIVSMLYNRGKKGLKEAAILSVLRIFLAGAMFTGMATVLYSLAGSSLSLLVMYLFQKSKHSSIVLVSMLGGIFHNIGQIVVASIVVHTASLLYTYLPILIACGAITGFLIGILSEKLQTHLHFLL